MELAILSLPEYRSPFFQQIDDGISPYEACVSSRDSIRAPTKLKNVNRYSLVQSRTYNSELSEFFENTLQNLRSGCQLKLKNSCLRKSPLRI